MERIATPLLTTLLSWGEGGLKWKYPTPPNPPIKTSFTGQGNRNTIGKRGRRIATFQ
jgi:hypothetical protein